MRLKGTGQRYSNGNILSCAWTWRLHFCLSFLCFCRCNRMTFKHHLILLLVHISCLLFNRLTRRLMRWQDRKSSYMIKHMKANEEKKEESRKSFHLLSSLHLMLDLTCRRALYLTCVILVILHVIPVFYIFGKDNERNSYRSGILPMVSTLIEVHCQTLSSLWNFY